MTETLSGKLTSPLVKCALTRWRLKCGESIAPVAKTHYFTSENSVFLVPVKASNFSCAEPNSYVKRSAFESIKSHKSNLGRP